MINLADLSLKTSPQRGAALVVAMVLLVVITLVSLAGVSGTILQNRMAAGHYDREIAFQMAEAALQVARHEIESRTNSARGAVGFMDCSDDNNCKLDPYMDSSAVGSIKTVTDSEYEAGDLAAGSPQYIVQYMGRFEAERVGSHQISNSGLSRASGKTYLDYYRVTARSLDPKEADGRAVVTLQAVYSR